jgi:hypothetical protein
MAEKFRANAGRALDKERTEVALATCLSLDTAPDLTALGRALRPT